MIRQLSCWRAGHTHRLLCSPLRLPPPTHPMKAKERDELLDTLKTRFENHTKRHKDLVWADVEAKLKGNTAALRSLHAMESSGGEPDVIAYDKKAAQYTFCDCSAESPAGRRSLCFDGEARDARKQNKPQGSAICMADDMGIELLDEDGYRALQSLGEFDLKTSSWVQTPSDIRTLGGALFCDRRFGKVFVYHNGAQSYYAARGFRGTLCV